MGQTGVRHSRRWWTALGVVVAVGVVALALKALHAKEISDATKARAHQHPIPVRTVQVTSGPVTAVIGATALTVPYEQIKIRIGPARRLRELNPVVKRVLAQDGTHVTAGQVVVELDAAQFELALAKAQKSLEYAESELAKAEAEAKENDTLRDVELKNAIDEVKFRTDAVSYYQEEADRLDRLYKQETAAVSERLKAEASLSEAQAELTKARVREQTARADIVVGPLRDQANVKQALESVASARVALELAKADLEECQLRSPFDGYVTEMHVSAGQLIDDTTELGVLMRTDPILVQLDFPQERSDELQLDQRVELVFDTFPKETYEGRVIRIPVHVDTPKRVVPVIVQLANPNGRIKVGASGYARVQVSRQATTAPALALIDIDARAMAFVVENGRAHMRGVKTGPVVDEGVVEIAQGLKAGDEIVVYGQQDLRDNEPVDADWQTWTRRK
jgi:multidrug efflux pump subunit AcrA (membrane-fusion protein)